MWRISANKAGEFTPGTWPTMSRTVLYRGAIDDWTRERWPNGRHIRCDHRHRNLARAQQCAGEMAAAWNLDEYPELVCPECGTPVLELDGVTPVDGDGYDGLCASCADKAERAGRWS